MALFLLYLSSQSARANKLHCTSVDISSGVRLLKYLVTPWSVGSMTDEVFGSKILP